MKDDATDSETESDAAAVDGLSMSTKSFESTSEKYDHA